MYLYAEICMQHLRKLSFNHPKLQVTKRSFNRWIDKFTVMHHYNGILFSNKIEMSRSPISSFTCKEFGIHHCVQIASKKLNKLKNQQLFLDPKEQGYWANVCSQGWRYTHRQMQESTVSARAETQEWKLPLKLVLK